MHMNQFYLYNIVENCISPFKNLFIPRLEHHFKRNNFNISAFFSRLISIECSFSISANVLDKM